MTREIPSGRDDDGLSGVGRPISKRITAFLSLLLLVVAALITMRLAYGLSQPLSQQVLTAQHLEYHGEAFPADGGSRVFFFQMQPGRQPLTLLVRHRNATFGANPSFQEIWIDRSANFDKRTDVLPGSPLEAKLVELLQAATTITYIDNPRLFRDPPNPERPKWIIERIKDRKSTW